MVFLGKYFCVNFGSEGTFPISCLGALASKVQGRQRQINAKGGSELLPPEFTRMELRTSVHRWLFLSLAGVTASRVESERTRSRGNSTSLATYYAIVLACVCQCSV